MAYLYHSTEPKSLYLADTFKGSEDEYRESLKRTRTVYVGNLSFHTTEEQIYELFSLCGPVRRVVLGLHREDRTPGGFCFVEFYGRESADLSVRTLNKMVLDDRPLRVDYDYGFEGGRENGRGKFGGQVRDDRRPEFDWDPQRGGFGRGFGAPIALVDAIPRHHPQPHPGSQPPHRPFPHPHHQQQQRQWRDGMHCHCPLHSCRNAQSVSSSNLVDVLWVLFGTQRDDNSMGMEAEDPIRK
jgi:nuclear cap-binding protein subunit 2